MFILCPTWVHPGFLHVFILCSYMDSLRVCLILLDLIVWSSIFWATDVFQKPEAKLMPLIVECIRFLWALVVCLVKPQRRRHALRLFFCFYAHYLSHYILHAPLCDWGPGGNINSPQRGRAIGDKRGTSTPLRGAIGDQGATSTPLRGHSRGHTKFPNSKTETFNSYEVRNYSDNWNLSLHSVGDSDTEPYKRSPPEAQITATRYI